MEQHSADDELRVLAQLEEDLSAVDLAIGQLDSISAGDGSASAAAAQIELAVPAERFGGPAPAQVGIEPVAADELDPGTSDLVGDGLLDQ